MSDEKEIKLPIDTSLGKLPQKTKGSIVPVECKTMEEIRKIEKNGNKNLDKSK